MIRRRLNLWKAPNEHPDGQWCVAVIDSRIVLHGGATVYRVHSVDSDVVRFHSHAEALAEVVKTADEVRRLMAQRKLHLMAALRESPA